MKAGSLQISENYLLGQHTTFGVGGPARYFVVAGSEDDVVQSLDFAKGLSMPVFVLGGGSNVLISDEGFPGLVILDRIKGFSSSVEGEYVTVNLGAGEDWQDFVDRAADSNWQGVECLAGIPGTAGASPVQNIGAYGQDVSQVISRVAAVETDTCRKVVFSKEECGFGYRQSIFNSTSAGMYMITGVAFRLRLDGKPPIRYAELERYFGGDSNVTAARVRDAVMAIRDSKGLLVREGHESFRSGGSFFKNPIVSAEKFREIESSVARAGGCSNWAWPLDSGLVKLSAACLIQCAGFGRGYRKGNVGISPKHSLIIINRGSSAAAEIVEFAREVQLKVKDYFGVVLKPEIRLVGFPSSCLREDGA